MEVNIPGIWVKMVMVECLLAHRNIEQTVVNRKWTSNQVGQTYQVHLVSIVL